MILNLFYSVTLKIVIRHLQVTVSCTTFKAYFVSWVIYCEKVYGRSAKLRGRRELGFVFNCRLAARYTLETLMHLVHSRLRVELA